MTDQTQTDDQKAATAKADADAKAAAEAKAAADAKAKADAAAAAKAKATPVVATRRDQTVPGGSYIVNGVTVNAKGEPIAQKDGAA